MSTEDPQTLGELLNLFGQQLMQSLHVSIPATIVSYDSAARTCSVKLNSHQRIRETEIQLPVIDDVPVCFPRAGSAIIELPVTIGDPVLVIVSDRALDNWRGTGQSIEPDDPRCHNLNDAIVLPMGVYPDVSVAPTTKITIKSNGDVVLDTPASVYLGGELLADNVALSTKVMTELQKLIAVLTPLAPEITASTALVTGGTTPSPTATAIAALLSSGWPLSVASIKTKAQ
jgi:hypothetical protein